MERDLVKQENKGAMHALYGRQTQKDIFDDVPALPPPRHEGVMYRVAADESYVVRDDGLPPEEERKGTEQC